MFCLHFWLCDRKNPARVIYDAKFKKKGVQEGVLKLALEYFVALLS